MRMPEPQTQFYTYLWLRDDGTPYYVGKGKGRRGFRSQGHNMHRPKSQARISVQFWESEDKAFEMEKWWIVFYGRKDLGTGCLRNLTDGGDGISGFVHSEDFKKRIAESNRRRAKPKPIKEKKSRKKYSEEAKQRMSKAQKLSWERDRKGKIRKSRIRRIPTCHPMEKYQGKGLCRRCYLRNYHSASL
jgi:hypothetical protein